MGKLEKCLASQLRVCIPRACGQIGHDFPCVLTLNICGADVLVCQGETHPGNVGGPKGVNIPIGSELGVTYSCLVKQDGVNRPRWRTRPPAHESAAR